MSNNDYIVLIVGQDFKQLTHWFESKMLEFEDSGYLYKPKEYKLSVKHEHGDTIYYGWSKTQDYRNLQGFRGNYVIFLEGDYPSGLVNTAVYRCGRKGLISEL